MAKPEPDFSLGEHLYVEEDILKSWLGTYVGQYVLFALNTLATDNKNIGALERLKIIESKVSNPEKFKEIYTRLADLASRGKLPEYIGEFHTGEVGSLRDFLDKNYPDPRVLPDKKSSLDDRAFDAMNEVIMKGEFSIPAILDELKE